MRRVLLWIACHLGVGVIWVHPRVMRKAVDVVRRVEAIPGVLSGDYRRCEALGQMIKRDDILRRDAAMAIEYVIRQGVV